MTFTVGRATFTNSPRAVSQDGDVLSFNIDIRPSTLTEAKVLRQQVLGLANNEDEPVVPLTWDDDSDYDGFYTVLSASCEPTEAYLTNSYMRCVIALQRVTGGYSFPQTEQVTAAFTRTNSHALTGEAIVSTFPNVTSAIRDGAVWLSDSHNRPVSDGSPSLTVYLGVPTINPLAFSTFNAASLHYHGAARLEVNIGGTWYPVMGDQVPFSDFWRISNGIVRLTSGDGATTGTIEVWNGSAWESRNIRHFSNSGTAAQQIGLAYDTDRSPIRVLRNSPERVVVRCASTVGLTVDYSIQRGAMHVEFRSSSAIGIGFDSSHAAACTAITGGIHATAADANGNRVVFGCAQTFSSTLGSGIIWVTSGAASFMVGVNLDASTSLTAGHTVTDLIAQFIGYAPVRQRVMAR